METKGAGDIVITMSGRASFSDDISETVSRIAFVLHIAYTHPLGGVDLPFGGYDL